jgi:hypothetical protein
VSLLPVLVVGYHDDFFGRLGFGGIGGGGRRGGAAGHGSEGGDKKADHGSGELPGLGS